jgi:hypothetical protein
MFFSGNFTPTVVCCRKWGHGVHRNFIWLHEWRRDSFYAILRGVQGAFEGAGVLAGEFLR